MQDETKIGGDRGSFQPTAWTRILQAQHGPPSNVTSALEHLIDLYWKPVYFYIRRNGYGVEDAKDLTQHYFMLFLERGALMSVSPAKGKFRTFLLASVRNFLCDQHDRRNAKKRTMNDDFHAADKQFSEQSNFERDWAMVILDRAFGRLKTLAPREAHVLEVQRAGKTPYKELADELGTTEANIKVLAHRGKRKLRAIILEELKETVSEPGQEENELNALFRAFSG